MSNLPFILMLSNLANLSAIIRSRPMYPSYLMSISAAFYNFFLSIGYFIQFSFKGTDVFGNVLNRYLRTVYQIYQFASLAQWSCAELSNTGLINAGFIE